MDAEGWTRSIVAPVHVGDRLAAVYLLLGKVPDNYDPLDIKRNVGARIQFLVRATALLIERWSDQDQLRSAASIDDLTGLLNRRELFSHIDNERRNGSMLYIDVDDFKSVNDGFGHPVGDQVLVELAQRIRAACRADDKIGRVGGDEFVVVLPGADTKLALDIARRILERVDQPLGLSRGPHTISVSIGHGLLDADDPVDDADHAMLRAKRRGTRLVTSTDFE